MAGLRWIRLDTDMFDNPKLLYLQDDKRFRAIVTHLHAMCYSGKHGLGGFLPKAALRVLGATSVDATHLVTGGLWEPAPGGWQINDWDEYQLSDGETARRSDKAKKAAAARWAVRNGRGAH